MRVIKLFRLAKGFWFLFIVAVLFVIIHQYTYSNVPLFTQYLIQTLVKDSRVIVGTASVSEVNLPAFLIRFFEQGSDTLYIIIRIALALVLLQVFRFTMRFFEMWIKGNLFEKMAETHRKRMYAHIQSLDYKFHNNVDTGDLIQRVTTDIETVTNFLTKRMLDFIYLIVTVYFGAYQLLKLNPTMVWVSFGILPLIGAASIVYFKKVDKLFINIEEIEAKMVTVVQENLTGLKVVRAFANEKYELTKMEDKNRAHADALIKANKIIALYWGSMDALSISQYLLIIAIAVYAVKQGTMDAASVAAALQLVGMLIWPIRGLGRLINDFGKSLVSSDRLNEIYDKKSEFENDGTEEINIRGDIEFKNVSFKFDDSKSSLLKDVSFKINAGETVAIIGRTGSGKSTIIHLLMRMYEYQNGEILIDQIPLKTLKKKNVRSQMGVVLQEPFLYSKTVFENIAITNKKINTERVRQAATTAALQKDIDTFKQGYETLVGEKGTTLSGGQKQRVAIARILVQDHPILIFDDALSAVDTQTDLMIRQALLEKNYQHTTMIITHRITTAKEADKIIVLNEGRVENIGTHDSLKNKEGLYKTLWDIQGKLEEEFEDMIKAGDQDAS
jgi:ATP-binding cassette subfamily B protein